MFKKRYELKVYEINTGKIRDTAVPYRFRFMWTADRAWKDLERMRVGLGFDSWYHMIVDIEEKK